MEEEAKASEAAAEAELQEKRDHAIATRLQAAMGRQRLQMVAAEHAKLLESDALVRLHVAKQARVEGTRAQVEEVRQQLSADEKVIASLTERERENEEREAESEARSKQLSRAFESQLTAMRQLAAQQESFLHGKLQPAILNSEAASPHGAQLLAKAEAAVVALLDSSQKQIRSLELELEAHEAAREEVWGR